MRGVIESALDEHRRNNNVQSIREKSLLGSRGGSLLGGSHLIEDQMTEHQTLEQPFRPQALSQDIAA